MLPYVNATLMQVNGAGTTDDYDTPGAPGAIRWAGSCPCYVAREVKEAESPGRVDELIKTRLELPFRIGSMVQRGDTLTYRFGGQTEKSVAADLTGSELTGRMRIIVEDD